MTIPDSNSQEGGKVEPHPCRFFNGKCIDCGRSRGAPRSPTPSQEGRSSLSVETWQPIETAPKNGKEILVWREDCGVLVAQWTCPQDFLTDAEVEIELSDMEGEDRESLERSMRQYDWFAGDSLQAGFRLEGSEVPTRWMPMPGDPEEQA